jgi:hypothetical protein
MCGRAAKIEIQIVQRTIALVVRLSPLAVSPALAAR